MTVEAIPDLTRRRRLWLSLDAAQMTAGDMGFELGVSRATITRWLASDDAPIKAGFLKQWALRCGVPYEWLATGSEGSGAGTTWRYLELDAPLMDGFGSALPRLELAS